MEEVKSRSRVQFLAGKPVEVRLAFFRGCCKNLTEIAHDIFAIRLLDQISIRDKVGKRSLNGSPHWGSFVFEIRVSEARISGRFWSAMIQTVLSSSNDFSSHLERTRTPQEHFNISNGYIPFGNFVPFCVYHHSIRYISDYFRNLERMWEIAVREKLVLEMEALSVAIYTPNLHVRSGFRIIITLLGQL